MKIGTTRPAASGTQPKRNNATRIHSVPDASSRVLRGDLHRPRALLAWPPHPCRRPPLHPFFLFIFVKTSRSICILHSAYFMIFFRGRAAGGAPRRAPPLTSSLLRGEANYARAYVCVCVTRLSHMYAYMYLWLSVHFAGFEFKFSKVNLGPRASGF